MVDGRFSVVSLGLDSDMLLVTTSLFTVMPHTYVQIFEDSKSGR